MTGELLDIGFGRLDNERLKCLSDALGLESGFGQSSEFEQLPDVTVTIGEVILSNATVGCYPFQGAKDLEISINHPETEDGIRQLGRAVRALASDIAIQTWKVGIEPLDDEATLYISNFGRGPIWPS